jgi:hypothetical protein
MSFMQNCRGKNAAHETDFAEPRFGSYLHDTENLYSLRPEVHLMAIHLFLISPEYH